MPRLYLPTHQFSTPYPNPQNEREELLNRLYETRTLLPGAREMPIEQLRDYVQNQEGKERTGHYDKYVTKRTADAVNARKREQEIGALREFAEWRRKKAQEAGEAPKE